MRLPMRRRADHAVAFRFRDRRVHGAEQGDASDLHTLERVTDDARVQSFQVDGDIGQLRHVI